MLDTLKLISDKMLRPKKKTIADMGRTQAKIAVSVRFGCTRRE